MKPRRNCNAAQAKACCIIALSRAKFRDSLRESKRFNFFGRGSGATSEKIRDIFIEELLPSAFLLM